MPEHNTPFAYSVTGLNTIIQQMVKTTPNLQHIDIVGEISNLTKHYSGHWYFSLKDERSRIKAVMFARYNQLVDFNVNEGDMVIVHGNVDYYGPSGALQFNVTTMKPYGQGALLAKLQQLIAYYQTKGYFDVTSKKPLPKYPFHIGVITGANSAAQADIHTTLKRRWPVAKVYEINTLVQGEGASEQIATALKTLDGKVDVIIVARGGGSIEDLWAFNDALLVETIHNMVTPVVSGVGHDSDTTLIDYIADVAANTPTGAVELATPVLNDVITTLNDNQHRLIDTMAKRFDLLRSTLAHHQKTLTPHLIRSNLDLMSQRLDQLIDQLKSIESRLNDQHHRLDMIVQRLDTLISTRLLMQRQVLNQKSTTLDALSPLKILNRGYTMSLDEHNYPITSIHQIDVDQMIVTIVNDGTFTSQIKQIERKTS